MHLVFPNILKFIVNYKDDIVQGSQTQILSRAELAIKNVPRAAH